MKIFSPTEKAATRRCAASVAAAVFGLGFVACGETASRESGDTASRESEDSPNQGDFMNADGLKPDPSAAGHQLALEALEANDVTQVVTTLTAPLLGHSKGLALQAEVERAIDATIARFGANCVTVARQPGADLFNSTATFDFTDCSGPLQQLSFSGTSTTNFRLDLLQRSVSITTEDDLVVRLKDGRNIPVVSTRSGTLSDRGLELDLEYTGIQGEPRHVSGLLEVAIGGNGCVVASLTGTEEVKGSGFQVSNLELCADGLVCVGGVELKVLGFGVSLDFQSGSVTFSRPNAAPVDIALPTSTRICLDTF